MQWVNKYSMALLALLLMVVGVIKRSDLAIVFSIFFWIMVAILSGEKTKKKGGRINGRRQKGG